MKRYTITTEGGLKFHVLADEFVITEFNMIGFNRILGNGTKVLVFVTPITSTVEVHDIKKL